MSVEKKFYGYTADQKEISSYTLTNKSGMKAVLLDIGAVIESLLHPSDTQGLLLLRDLPQPYNRNVLRHKVFSLRFPKWCNKSVK